MSITSIKRDWGVSPSIVRITSTDDLATITTAGYLDSERSNILAINDGDFQWEVGDLILIYYFDNQWSFFSRDSSNNLMVVIAGGSGDVQPFNIQQQTYTFADDDGVVNAYHAAYTPAISSYVKGMRLTFNTINGNTSGSTFAADGLPPLSIILADGSPLPSGTIPADSNVDLMLRDDGNWQLMGISFAGSTVTPADIQSQAFTYTLDTSVGPNAYIADFTPPMTTTDGTKFDVLINGTGTNTVTDPSITVNGIGYNIYLENGNSIALNDILLGVIAQFELLDGNATLLNPQSGSNVTPQEIQNQFFTASIDSGIADAYIGSYTPTIALANITTLELKIGATNVTTTPTFDCNDGSGPLPIVLGDGSAVSVGSLAAGMIAIFAYDAANTRWQLINPTNSFGTTDQIVGAFTPSLLNYTLNGGTGLVATGTYVATGANLFINAYFTNPGGTINSVLANGNFSNFPANPINPAQELVTGDTNTLSFSSPYNISVTGGFFPTSILMIDQSGTKYIVLGGESAQLQTYTFDIISTNPGFQLTALGGPQATAFQMTWLDTFVYSGTIYVIGCDFTSNNFTTVSFNGGTISAVTTTATTASPGGRIHQFINGGIQYCAVRKLNSNLETFSFNGSLWTSVDDITVATNTGGLTGDFTIFDIAGTTYMVTADNQADSVSTWSWTGVTWIPAAADLTSLTGADLVNPLVFNGDTFLCVGFSSAINLYLWSGVAWTLQSSFAEADQPVSMYAFIRNGVPAIQYVNDGNFIQFLTLQYDTPSTFVSMAAHNVTTTSDYFSQPLVFGQGDAFYSFGPGSFTDTVGAYALATEFNSSNVWILTDGVGYLNGALVDCSSIWINATYQTIGLTSITFPNSVVQTFSTFFAPLAFNSGLNQTYVFDAIVGPVTPVTYSAGTFTFPGVSAKTWEIIGQFYAPTQTMDNMRLHISSPGVVDFYYTSPAITNNTQAWTYISWRGQIQESSTMQVLFDSSNSGTIDNGSGTWQGITSFMTIRQI